MTRLAAAGVVTLALLVAAGAAWGARPGGARVERVIDGDTIVLANGRHVRLVQIDSTELGSGECYSRKAAAVLRRLLPEGSRIRLVADPRLDEVDRYGRLLRYVYRGSLDVNLELVRRGAATAWFYEGERGRYAGKLLAAMRHARARRLGMWHACRVVWNPDGPATTFGGGSPPPGGSGSASATGTAAAGTGCSPSYRPCLPVVGGLDCGDIPDSKKPVHVIGPDVYHLDGDGDKVGCEAG